jgi:hypothetical protein
VGLRFRRSLRLLPGVRLNVGLRSSSISVGVKGARVNFSSRGARTTFGAPGTGLSWTSSAPSATRRPSFRQLEAAQRREAKAELAAAAVAIVEVNEERQRDIVDAWRDLPEVPDATFYEDACRLRRFDFGEPQEAPSEASEEGRYREELEITVRSQVREPVAMRVGLSAAAGLAVGGPLCTVHAYAGLVAIVLVPVVLWLETGARSMARLRDTVDGLMRAGWAGRWSDIVQAHQRELTDHEVRRRQAEDEWDAREGDRVAWAQRVRDGDPETVETTLVETLSDLDFPFETECAAAVIDAGTGYVLLDLPEIEDVIPEMRLRALKDGRVKEVKRSKAERFADYARLAAGLALLLARTAFSAGPTLQTVHLAAYTQRRQRSSAALRDDFVYEVQFSRQHIASLVSKEIDPLAVVVGASSRIDVGANGQLKKISAPTWLHLVASEGGNLTGADIP